MNILMYSINLSLSFIFNIIPSTAIETLPVSSETIMVKLSVISLIPKPARCLEPVVFSKFVLSDNTKYAPAHKIVSPRIITAPS